MEGICVNFLDPDDQFFRFPKGRCHANQFCGKITYHPAVIALAFRNGMGYHYLNVRINSVNDACISCKNSVNFGPITPEKKGLNLLGGDTAAPNGLYARLCHAFLV